MTDLSNQQYSSDKKLQKTLSKPIPKKIINAFKDKALTATQIAEIVNFPKDKIYYHIKKLVALDILYVSETEQVKGIVQKKFFPKKADVVSVKKARIDKKDTRDKLNTNQDYGNETLHSPKSKDYSSNKIITNNDDLNNQEPSSLRSILDRRKSRDRRSKYNRRSTIERRIKHFFDYNSIERRIEKQRRILSDRRFSQSRRVSSDRRLESNIKNINKSQNRTNINNSSSFISSPLLFSSLAHLKGMSNAITFVQSGNRVTYLQAKMGMDDFIVQNVIEYTLPMHIDNHVINTLPELIRHVYYQSVDTNNMNDYYLAFCSSDYDYQMVYVDTKNIKDDIETYISEYIPKTFSIKYDKAIMDWSENKSSENNAVVCYSTKIDSINNDYNALTNFGIQPRYNTSIPQVIYNIYMYSHFGIGAGNTIVFYIENHRTNLILIQNSQLVDSQFFTIGFDSFMLTINDIFINQDDISHDSKIASKRFLLNIGIDFQKEGSGKINLSDNKLDKIIKKLTPLVESFKSEIISSYNYFNDVRNKLSDRGLIVDNVFIGGPGAQIKNMKTLIKNLLNFPVHSLDDLYLGHTKKLTVPKQQKKLARNQKSLLKVLRKTNSKLLKINEKIEQNNNELNIYNDLSKLENERDTILLDKADRLKELEKTNKSLLLAKLKRTKLDDNYNSEKNKLSKDLNDISIELDKAEKNLLAEYKEVDAIHQYASDIINRDQSSITDTGKSLEETQIVIRDLKQEIEENDEELNSNETDIQLYDANIIQQEKAIELTLKEHVELSSDLNQSIKQDNYFTNNPFRSPNTTLDLKRVLEKDGQLLEKDIKDLNMKLIVKKSVLDKHKEERLELIKKITPLNLELEKIVDRLNKNKSTLISVKQQYENCVNDLAIIDNDFHHTSSIHTKNLSELKTNIDQLYPDNIKNNIQSIKSNLAKCKSEKDRINRKLNSFVKQYELDYDYFITDQKNLEKRRKSLQESFDSTHRKILKKKELIDDNIENFNDSNDEMKILDYLNNVLETVQQLSNINYSQDLMELNNENRSIETALATSEKSITWTLSQLDHFREQFYKKHSDNLKPKKNSKKYEIEEQEYIKNILFIMDTLIQTPKNLNTLKNLLFALKASADSKSALNNKIESNEHQLTNLQLEKEELLRDNNKEVLLLKKISKYIKTQNSDLIDKRNDIKNLKAENVEKNNELEHIRLLNQTDSSNSDDIIKSRFSKIEKIKLDIEELQRLKEIKKDLIIQKNNNKSILIDILKNIDLKQKKLEDIKNKELINNNDYENKKIDLNKKYADLNKEIEGFFDIIASEKNNIDKSSLRLKEINNEKQNWKEEIIILKDEQKALNIEKPNILKLAKNKKESFRNKFLANIEEIENEKVIIINEAGRKKEKVKQFLFSELDTLGKQEEKIQIKLNKETAKIDTINNKIQNLEDSINKERNKTHTTISLLNNESNSLEDQRDRLQKSIYKIQKLLKIEKSKKIDLEEELSDRIMDSGEKLSVLNDRIAYKETEDYFIFIMESLSRLDSNVDQKDTARNIISESLGKDIDEVSKIKNTLKDYKKNTQKKLKNVLDKILSYEKQLKPYRKQRDGLSRKLRLINNKVNKVNTPLFRLEKKYNKAVSQKELNDKNFLIFQNNVENEFSTIYNKRGDIEDAAAQKIKNIDDDVKNELTQIQNIVEQTTEDYNLNIHKENEGQSYVIEKINKRLDKINILLSAGKEIQEKNNLEKSSLLSGNKSSAQIIKKQHKQIQKNQGELKKVESRIKSDSLKYSNYNEKILTQLENGENELIAVKTKKDKQDQSLQIIENRINEFNKQHLNIDSDIKNFKEEIVKINNQINLEGEKQSEREKIFNIAETKILDDIDAIYKNIGKIELIKSQLLDELYQNEEKLELYKSSTKQNEKRLYEIGIKTKEVLDNKKDFINKLDTLNREMKKIESKYTVAINLLKENEKSQKEIIPIIVKRSQLIKGFLKESKEEQNLLKGSLKELEVIQKSNSSNIVSIESDINSLSKKINSIQKENEVNKKTIELDRTNNNILIERLKSDLIQHEDKLSSVKIELKTLLAQKEMTNKTIKSCDDDYKNQRNIKMEVLSSVEKEKNKINNEIVILEASANDLKKNIDPLKIKCEKLDILIGDYNSEIEDANINIKKLNIDYNENIKNLKKADDIISSEQHKLRKEEEALKIKIRELESNLESANNYITQQRKNLESSIKKKVELEKIYRINQEKRDSLEMKLEKSESSVLDKKKIKKFKNKEKILNDQIDKSENKIKHLRENYRSLKEIMLDIEKSYKGELGPVESKMSSAELLIIDLKDKIRKINKRISELNRHINIAPVKQKKLKELNHKYLSYKNQYTLRLKEAERELDIIRKKIDLIGQETNNEDKIGGDYLKEIDYIANLGLLLNPNETLNILPKQHKVDYNFFIPNRVLQLFTILFIFISSFIGIYKTNYLNVKEGLIPEKLKNQSVISSEIKVYQELMNDISILDQYNNKIVTDDINSINIISLLKYVSSNVPKEFKVTELRVDKASERKNNSNLIKSSLEPLSLNVYVGGFVKMNLFKSKQVLDSFKNKIQKNKNFKEILISENESGNKDKTLFTINLLL